LKLWEQDNKLCLYCGENLVDSESSYQIFFSKKIVDEFNIPTLPLGFPLTISAANQQHILITHQTQHLTLLIPGSDSSTPISFSGYIFDGLSH
jgi:hypothetical protein